MSDRTARPIGICVNGKAVAIAAHPATRLTNVLRDHLGLMGTKVGCNAGHCGACTVLLDKDPVCAGGFNGSRQHPFILSGTS
jgi:aerobic-type carbon monoxide dehydrogenase small subunit (CoxS/CutS family)